MPVRTALVTDAEVIARIQVETWRVAYREMMPEVVLAAQQVDQRTPFWTKYLESGRGEIFVMEIADSLAGFCNLEFPKPGSAVTLANQNEAEIAALYVLPQYWRCGFGRNLCLHTLAVAQQAGCQALGLWTLEANISAHRFYHALGFREDGRRTEHILSDGSTVPALRFVKELR